MEGKKKEKKKDTIFVYVNIFQIYGERNVRLRNFVQLHKWPGVPIYLVVITASGEGCICLPISKTFGVVLLAEHTIPYHGAFWHFRVV